MARNVHRKARVALSSFVLAVIALALMTYVAQAWPGPARGWEMRALAAAEQVGQARQAESDAPGAHEGAGMLEALIEDADHDEARRRAAGQGPDSWAHAGAALVQVGSSLGPEGE